MTKLLRAKEVQIVYKDDNGNEKTWQEAKGLVNEENENQRFSIVGVGYKVAQHEEVNEMVEESIKELGLNHNTNIITMDDGARIRIKVDFNDVKFRIDETDIVLRVNYDNSYNCTTGLRLIVEGIHGRTVFILPDNIGQYYHRHTKGLNLKDLIKKLEKGIETFKTKAKATFEKFLATSMTNNSALAWLDDLITKAEKDESKSKHVPIKYLKLIRIKVNKEGVNTVWDLYKCISEVLTQEIESVDTRKTHATKLNTALNKMIKEKKNTLSESQTMSRSDMQDGQPSLSLVEGRRYW